VRRLFILLGLALTALLAFDACGISEQGDPDGPDGGGASGGSGGGVGGGTCFPGSKVCPDPSGKLKCLSSAAPETGCNGTGCEACITPHATATCNGQGNCAIDKCDAGHADCNGDATDGCEVDLMNSPVKCGDCNTDCIATHGSNWKCEAGKCAVNDCIPPTTSNCDGDKTNGCEVDLQTDVNNCGYCTNACNLAHATPTCGAPVNPNSIADCHIALCDTGYDDCDKNEANGCETNIASADKGNCGGCGKLCNETHGSGYCTGGVCGIICGAQGGSNWGDCDNNADANGCETNLSTDPLNCGACGKKCNPQHVNNPTCASGACGYDQCAAGYGDCDGDKTNGCETNLLTDKTHCGVCSTVCPTPSGGTAVCNGGTCGGSCSSPYTLCNSSCVNYSNDVSNCGSCNNKCTGNPPNSTPTCGGGNCGFNCNSGFGKCGSTTQCYDLATTVNHCGTCSTNCSAPPNATPACAGGSCGWSCNANYTKCSNNCVDITSDPNNCAACGTICPSPQFGNGVCVNSACDFTCDSGHTKCNGQCVDTKTDNGNCGSCSNACNNGHVCQASACVCTGATPDDCGGTCTNKQSDDANCGTCGNACTGGKKCQSSTCVCVAPTPDDCSGTCTNKQTDKQNCGTCGNACPGPQTCTGGTCS
jgi:hypothetical protein